MKQRDFSVDLFKFIASLMIVGIHTALFWDVNSTLYFIVVNVVFRMAVPYFAICTGYYLTRVMDRENLEISEKRKYFFRHFLKIVAMYAVWSVVYLIYQVPSWIETGWVSPMAFVDFAIGAVTKGAYYHLWYLLYLIYSLPVFYVLLTKTNKKAQKIIAPLLWFVACFFYVYYRFLPTEISRYFESVAEYSTIFAVLPLLLMGSFISRREIQSKKRSLICFAVSFVLLVLEALFLKESVNVDKYSYIVFTLPTAYFAFQTVIQIKCTAKNSFVGILGETSTWVYCIHPVFVGIIAEYVNNSILLFALSSLLSTAVAVGYILIKTKIKRGKSDV